MYSDQWLTGLDKVFHGDGGLGGFNSNAWSGGLTKVRQNCICVGAIDFYLYLCWYLYLYLFLCGELTKE